MSETFGSLCPKFMKLLILEYYDLVNVSLKSKVASHSTTQVAVTFTINIEQVRIYRSNDDFNIYVLFRLIPVIVADCSSLSRSRSAGCNISNIKY